MSTSVLEKEVKKVQSAGEVVISKDVVRHLKSYAEDNNFNEGWLINIALQKYRAIHQDMLKGVRFSFVFDDGDGESLKCDFQSEINTYTNSLTKASIRYDLIDVAVGEKSLTETMVKRLAAAKKEELNCVFTLKLLNQKWLNRIILNLII